MANTFRLLTFYTLGEPFDKGQALSDAEQLFRRTVEPFVDDYRAITPAEIRESKTCEDYYDWLLKQPDCPANYNFQWARIGFFQWKPFIIWKLLSNADVRFGDIILYHDVDCIKYPQYLEGAGDWRSLCEYLLTLANCDIFIPRGLSLMFDVKSYLLRKYAMVFKAHLPGVWAGAMVMRKSEKLLTFVREWMKLCLDLRNIAPVPSSGEDRRFIWHSVDQSVLGVLTRRWCEMGMLPETCIRYGLRDRKMLRSAIH